MNASTLLAQIEQGSQKALARAVSFVENEAPGYDALLARLPHRQQCRVVGITGPPGAGKSTLVDGLIGQLIDKGKKVAVLCVDPSSPFNLGAVLGDRIRMSQWYTHPQVFIRSLATRGSLGGLHPKIIEITELMRAAGFDYVLVETVGVGQSEVEIAGLADTTLVVLVPEAGDEVQTMKAGLMEIADLFVVNKADRPGADAFVKALRAMLAPTFGTHRQEVPIVKTVAATGAGLDVLSNHLEEAVPEQLGTDRRLWLLTERAYQLVQRHRMQSLSKEVLMARLRAASTQPDFNLYRFAQSQFYETAL
ncbi:methylmalonyl Co-A mutase-associated GTPase MeaB [Paracnuella aquatica]|uniref:methylmalonyl Co-A mutase-associated GTPase MeaB n=1 Tax=Paracnuella aquatica TaxID=2268757 RepID=UPI000DEF2C2D|nr:methylmalonyl Co-A mutase-associated GTPase MeaB [Paracnuella aquatica]RPD50817.1 methylmalonyl Co-A mutase-associated GTPase MeaB [Paracnuella aquatica]